MGKPLTFFGMMICLLCQPTEAGYKYPFAQIACVPEYRFFDVRYKAIPEGALEFIKDEDLKNRDPWAPNGFYGTANLDYECKIPDAAVIFSLKISEGLAECGFFKERLITIKRNEEILIDQVHFGHSCRNEVVIQDINIIDPRQGWNSGSIEVCFRLRSDGAMRCWQDFDLTDRKSLPINKHWIDMYLKLPADK